MSDYSVNAESSGNGGNALRATAPFILLILAYLPALTDLVVDWSQDSNYSHGFLVPLVALYLIWTRRSQIAALPRQIDIRGLWVIIAGMGLFIAANGAAEYFTLRFSFVLTLFGLALYLFGMKVIRETWFAFFFLLFMIPVPYVLYYAATFPMQLLASKTTVVALQALGMNVIRQGIILHLPGYSLEVAEACSGMRSLVTLLALGALYAYSTQKHFISRLTLFVSTVPIAIVGNIFRVFITALLVYATGVDVTAEPMHSITGMSVFIVAFVMPGIVGALLKRAFK
jgi:exosortase